MSAHSQPSVGIDHPTVVPANFEPEDDADEALDADDRPTDTDEPANTTDDGRADT